MKFENRCPVCGKELTKLETKRIRLCRGCKYEAYREYQTYSYSRSKVKGGENGNK